MKISFPYSEERIKKIKENGYLLEIDTEEDIEEGQELKAYLIVPLELFDGKGFYIEKNYEGEKEITGEGYIGELNRIAFEEVTPEEWAEIHFNSLDIDNSEDIIFVDVEGNILKV